MCFWLTSVHAGSSRSPDNLLIYKVAVFDSGCIPYQTYFNHVLNSSLGWWSAPTAQDWISVLLSPTPTVAHRVPAFWKTACNWKGLLGLHFHWGVKSLLGLSRDAFVSIWTVWFVPDWWQFMYLTPSLMHGCSYELVMSACLIEWEVPLWASEMSSAIHRRLLETWTYWCSSRARRRENQ